MQQEEFLKKIYELIDYANEKDGAITEEEMLAPFKGEKLDKKQLEAIKSFLTANAVRVVSATAVLKAKEQPKMMAASMGPAKNLSSKERKIYEAYLEEMSGLAKLGEKECVELVTRMRAGDETAKEKLIEGCLYKVVDIAAEFAGYGIPLSDLVQEGNLGLIMFLEETAQSDDEVDAFEEKLAEKVRFSMDELFMEDSNHNAFKDRIMVLANKMLEIQEELERKHEEGEDVFLTIEDLAERLRATPEEIETVMKMSLNAADMEESGFGGE